MTTKAMHSCTYLIGFVVAKFPDRRTDVTFLHFKHILIRLVVIKATFKTKQHLNVIKATANLITTMSTDLRINMM